MPLTSSSGTGPRRPRRTATRSSWPSTAMLRQDVVMADGTVPAADGTSTVENIGPRGGPTAKERASRARPAARLAAAAALGQPGRVVGPPAALDGLRGGANRAGRPGCPARSGTSPWGCPAGSPWRRCARWWTGRSGPGRRAARCCGSRTATGTDGRLRLPPGRQSASTLDRSTGEPSMLARPGTVSALASPRSMKSACRAAGSLVVSAFQYRMSNGRGVLPSR